MVYEIELKSFLTEDQYADLSKKLVSVLELFNEDVITTTRYRPGDIRMRISPKICELVQKEVNPTGMCRSEHIYPLDDRVNFEPMKEALVRGGYSPDPSWTKHKKDFIYRLNGFDYVVSLQRIENFADILKVEFISQVRNPEFHEPNLVAIVKSLGIELQNPVELKKRIQDPIEKDRP